MKKKQTEGFPRKKMGKGGKIIFFFLSLFILQGLGFGLFATFQTIQVQSWVEVETTVDSTFYKNRSFTKRRKVGKKTKRKSVTTSQTRAKYTYQWEGKTYQSDQIALWQSSTKVKERNAALKKLLDEANTVKAFVNPDDPNEAVLIRSIHNGILFFYISAFACFLVR